MSAIFVSATPLPTVLPSFRHPLIDLISTGARRSLLVRHFPFLKDAPTRMCQCDHPAFEQLDVLLHMWDQHVNGVHDWSEARLGAWVESIAQGKPRSS